MRSATLTHAVTSNDIRYHGHSVDPVVVNVIDNTAGFVLSAIDSVPEGGMASFTVMLNTVPTGEVTVVISSDSEAVTVSSDSPLGHRGRGIDPGLCGR